MYVFEEDFAELFLSMLSQYLSGVFIEHLPDGDFPGALYSVPRKVHRNKIDQRRFTDKVDLTFLKLHKPSCYNMHSLRGGGRNGTLGEDREIQEEVSGFFQECDGGNSKGR